MQRISTHDLGLSSPHTWGFTTLLSPHPPFLDRLAIFDECDESWAAQVYSVDTETGIVKKTQALDKPCDHDFYNLTSSTLDVEVQGQALLAVACAKCQDIKLMDPQTGQVTVAYKNSKYQPSVMCPGGRNRLWVFSSKAPYSVFELNTSEREFTETGTSLGVFLCYHMYYIPGVALVCSDRSKVRVVHVHDQGSRFWNLQGVFPVEHCPVDQKKLDPSHLLYLSEHKCLLVADFHNTRILKVNPSDGSVQQILLLPEELGQPVSMRKWYKNQLAVQYTTKNAELSFFLLKELLEEDKNKRKKTSHPRHQVGYVFNNLKSKQNHGTFPAELLVRIKRNGENMNIRSSRLSVAITRSCLWLLSSLAPFTKKETKQFSLRCLIFRSMGRG